MKTIRCGPLTPAPPDGARERQRQVRCAAHGTDSSVFALLPLMQNLNSITMPGSGKIR